MSANLLVVVLCGTISGRAKAEPHDEILVTQELCAAGPSAALARARRLRGEAAVTAARVLPNPSLVAEHQHSLSGRTERETTLGLSVPLGVGGRRYLLQDAAAARSDQARADARAGLFESALAFREAYVRATAEQARVEVLVEQQTALDALSSVIQRLAKGGEAAGYDLLRQKMQARLHRGLLESAKARSSSTRALLQVWTERELKVPAMAAPVRRTEAFLLTESSSRRTAHLRSLEAASRASNLEARAARRRWVPDLDAFVGYRQITSGDETGHGVALALTVPLTLFDHGQGEAAQCDAEHEVLVATATRLRREQRAEVKAARLRLEGLATALADVEQAGIEAVEVLTKARQLYAAGEASITELLEAFRSAEEVRLAYLDLTEQLAQTRLALMRAAGTMFDPTLDRLCGGSGGAP